MRDFLEAVLDPDNWKPSIAKIAIQTGKGISTTSDKLNRMMEECKIQVRVKDLPDSEAQELKKIKQMRENGSGN